MSDDQPKTIKEMVTDALTSVVTEMWREENPYLDPQDYAYDFQRFCERKLFCAMGLRGKQ
jgi:hypothetical protein